MTFLGDVLMGMLAGAVVFGAVLITDCMNGNSRDTNYTVEAR